MYNPCEALFKPKFEYNIRKINLFSFNRAADVQNCGDISASGGQVIQQYSWPGVLLQGFRSSAHFAHTW